MTIRFTPSRSVPRGKALETLARGVCRLVPALRGAGEICVIFVSGRELLAINRRFLRHDYDTDIITFQYPKPSHADEPFGDLYVSVDFARGQAKSGGYALVQELALLVVHGLLHLAGYDDRTSALKARMFAQQRRLLRTLAPELAPPDFQ